MCQALREMMQDSKMDGMREAYKNLIRKKLSKNKTPVQIAEELELELAEVQEFIELIHKEQTAQV